MTTRSTPLVVMIIGVAVLASTLGAKPIPLLMWNASESVPRGLYRVRLIESLAVGDLVVVVLPEPLTMYMAKRRYLPVAVPLIKHVLALPGQSVCRNEGLITIDGMTMGIALTRDRHDHALPVWQGCRLIAQDEVFLMNPGEPASFDGRYFGPVPRTTIMGRAESMLTLRKE
jgi:conjugative transfer signal peptidase TraF